MTPVAPPEISTSQIYSLRKWTRLALKGNPTIMLLLFTPEEQLVYCDELGAELRALTPSIISRRVQGPFLGYLKAQNQRLTGERGQKRIHCPELEEMYGFDTKCAMHMLRLGFQGVELLTTGRLSCRLSDSQRTCGPRRYRIRGLSRPRWTCTRSPRSVFSVTSARAAGWGLNRRESDMSVPENKPRPAGDSRGNHRRYLSRRRAAAGTSTPR